MSTGIRNRDRKTSSLVAIQTEPCRSLVGRNACLR